MPLLMLTADPGASIDVLTTTVSWLVQNMTSMFNFIVEKPLLLLGVGFWAAGACIGLVHRLIHG